MAPGHFEKSPSQTLSIPQKGCSQRPLVLGFCQGASLLWDDGYTNTTSASSWNKGASGPNARAGFCRKNPLVAAG